MSFCKVVSANLGGFGQRRVLPPSSPKPQVKGNISNPSVEAHKKSPLEDQLPNPPRDLFQTGIEGDLKIKETPPPPRRRAVRIREQHLPSEPANSDI